MPLGSSMSRFWVEDETIAEARNKICQQAVDSGADYVFFVSDDVLVPNEAVLAMLDKIGRRAPVEDGGESTIDMITGVYWTKAYPTEPYLWKAPGLLGSYRNWTAGEFFPIDLAGCDCLMIDTRVLKETPYPWFSTDWLWNDEPKPSPIATEDFYFFTKTRKHGFRLFADTSIQCLHEDRQTGKQFGLTEDMPQVQGTPDFGDEKLYVAELGAGLESPYFGQNCTVIRFDGRADVSPDVMCSLFKMPETYYDRFDVVHARHTLEHFSRKEAPEVVTEWTKLLKIGGQLVIRVPNVLWALQRLTDETTEPGLRGYAFAQIWGGQDYEYDFHKNGFTARKLANLARFIPGLTEILVEEEQDGMNLKLTAKLAFRPKYESIGVWWEEIAAMQRPKLPEIDYDNPGDIEVPDAPRAEDGETPKAAPAKKKAAPKRKASTKAPATNPGVKVVDTTAGDIIVKVTGNAWNYLPKNSGK